MELIEYIGEVQNLASTDVVCANPTSAKGLFTLLIINKNMGGVIHHARISQENMEGSIEEFKKRRFSNVGLLSLRALEQMIEACAAKEGLHFHEHPRTAHRNRRNWLKEHHPDLLVAWDQLWGIYGALGYGGLNGERAEQALSIVKECIAELGRREEIAIGGPERDGENGY